MKNIFNILALLGIILVNTAAGVAMPKIDLALLGAVKKNDIRQVRELIDKGANVYAKDDEGSTPLHLAAGNSQLDIVKLLIEKGGKVDAKDNDDYTPLYYALTALLPSKEVVKFLIAKGANVNAKSVTDYYTPLHIAAGLEKPTGPDTRLDIVRLLVEKSAKVNARNEWDNTPLHTAFEPQFPSNKVVRFLLAKGASVDAKNIEGLTPLHLAVMNPNTSREILSILLKKSHSPLTKDKFGKTILDLAPPRLKKFLKTKINSIKQ